MAYLHFLDSKGVLDIDRNGVADALTDGLLIFRKLLELEGDALINRAVATDCSPPCDVDAITTRLEGYIP